MNEKTTFRYGAWIEGEAEAAKEVPPEPVEAGGQIFPSAWHRDRYIADCEREQIQAEQRLANPALTDQQRAEYEAQAQVAKRESRPSGAARRLPAAGARRLRGERLRIPSRGRLARADAESVSG